METVGRFTLRLCATRWTSGVFDHLTLCRSVLPHHPSAQPAVENRGHYPHCTLFTHHPSNITYCRCGYNLFHQRQSYNVQSGGWETVSCTCCILDLWSSSCIPVFIYSFYVFIWFPVSNIHFFWIPHMINRTYYLHTLYLQLFLLNNISGLKNVTCYQLYLCFKYCIQPLELFGGFCPIGWHQW